MDKDSPIKVTNIKPKWFRLNPCNSKIRGET